jgi:hypothetical protein
VDELIAGEIGACDAGDLDRLARIGAGIVVVDLVDEDVRRGRGGRGIVVGDRAGRNASPSATPPWGALRVTVKLVVRFERRVALHRHADLGGGRRRRRS